MLSVSYYKVTQPEEIFIFKEEFQKIMLNSRLWVSVTDMWKLEACLECLQELHHTSDDKVRQHPFAGVGVGLTYLSKKNVYY